MTAANKMSKVRSADDWPSKRCICNLCNCGQHNCANFELTQFATNTKTSDKGDPTAKTTRFAKSQDNRCAKVRDSRMIDADHSMAEQLEERKLGANGEEIDIGQYCECNRQNGDRFLTVDNKVRPNNLLNGDDELLEDDDLLHVLVSRPEIASKPRDNIIFEGDMDLKTTFETSYEALAKMRLDHWKRHQERQQPVETSHRKQRPNEAEGLRNERAAATTNARQEPVGERKLEGNRRQQLAGVSVANAYKVNAKEPTYERHHEQTRREQQRLRAARSAGSGPPSRAGATTMTERQQQQQRPPWEPNELLGKQTQQLQHQQQKDSPIMSSNYTCIDPDISPIVVYDANMNRLERVGLRRRNKYRPSTTLRPGTRGLFGDQEELRPEETRRQQQANEYATSRTIFSQEKANAVSKAGLSEQNRDHHDQQQRSGSGNPEKLGRGDLALNKRNLKNSNQADYLVFSEQNLPLNSKRKLRDNVNMTDHIKEQSIVEVSYGGDFGRDKSSSWEKRNGEDRPTTAMTSSFIGIEAGKRRVDQRHTGEEKSALLEESLDNLKLAQQEEDSAVEELRRITRGAGEHPEATISGQQTQQRHHEAEAGLDGNGMSNATIVDEDDTAATATKDARCRSRLQRTCQNQNFDIHQNEYLEPKTRPAGRISGGLARAAGSGAGNPSGPRGSPLARFHNNLFRESPDFILTTGKFLAEEEEQQLQQPQEAHRQEEGSDSAVASTGQHNFGRGQESGTGIRAGNFNAANNNKASKRVQPEAKSRKPLGPMTTSGSRSMQTVANKRGGREDEEADNKGEENPDDDVGASRTKRGQAKSELAMIQGLNNRLSSPNSLECRVFELDKDFHYVGTQLGHKYFLEREYTEKLVNE